MLPPAKLSSPSQLSLLKMSRQSTQTAVIVAGLVACWVAMSEGIQGLQDKWTKPFFIVYTIHGGYALNLIFFVVLNFVRTGRMCGPCRRAAAPPEEAAYPVPLGQLVLVAFALQALGAVIAYTWYISLPLTLVSANNAIYQSSSAFVFVFAVVWHNEMFTWRKLCAVAVSVGGVVLICLMPTSGGGGSSSSASIHDSAEGYVWVIASTVTYAMYEVLYARWTQREIKRWSDVCGVSWWGAQQLLTGAPPIEKCSGEEKQIDCAASHPIAVGTTAEDFSESAPLVSSVLSPSSAKPPVSVPKLHVRRVSSDLSMMEGGSDESVDSHRSRLLGSSSALSALATPSAALDDAKLHDKGVSPVVQAEMTALVLGLMGTFTLLTLWPLFFVLHYSGAEPFELPSASKTALLALNTGLDSVYNLLLLYGITVSSPLVMSLGTMLVVPASLAADWVLHGATMSWAALGGVVLIGVGFLMMQRLHGVYAGALAVARACGCGSKCPLERY